MFSGSAYNDPDIRREVILEEYLRVVGVGGTLRENSASLGALRQALKGAEKAEAETMLLDLQELRLPMYEPESSLEEYGPEVRRFVKEIREADALILSTAAYHGTLAGVTKNALDFLQFLARDERPYLEDRVVGLISTAGGDLAAANANSAMVHTVHALRGIVAPMMVAVPKAWRKSENGEIVDPDPIERLERLGGLVVDLTQKLNDAPGQQRADRSAA